MIPKPHIWGLYLLLCLLIIFSLIGCGLPDYVALEAPDAYSGTLPSTVVAFTEPSDSNIVGYALFYKIYAGSDDFDDEDDPDWFDETSSYYSGDTEISTGDTVPNKRGFFKVGERGDDSDTMWTSYLIPAQGAGTTIYIDFDISETGTTYSRLRDPPVVGVGWDGTHPTATIMELARGFRDPTSSSDTLLEFVADWDFDDGSPDDDYNDGDLRRGYSKMKYQPGTTLSDVEACGTALYDSPSADDIYIGFVVYSFGRDPSILTALESKPVYLGRILYSPVDDADRVTTR